MPHNPTVEVAEVLLGNIQLLRKLLEADIARDGAYSSSMVRAGLLLDIIDLALKSASAPALYEACAAWIDWLKPDTPWREDAADYEAQMLDAMRAALTLARTGQP